ncbi:MAG: hypothetical protein ACO3IB_11785, partial [Phycisphaerales bacterium]
MPGLGGFLFLGAHDRSIAAAPGGPIGDSTAIGAASRYGVRATAPAPTVATLARVHDTLLDILVLLSAALALGMLAER